MNLRQIRWLGIFALTVSIALPLGCSKSGSQKDAGNTSSASYLRYPLRDDVKSLDPANAYDSVSLKVMPLTVESLFQYNYLKTPLELEPLLAAEMPKVSKDGKTYTIKIKQGVLFQDDAAFPNGKGRELKAQDFIYAWKRLLHPDLQSNGSWIFEDKVVGYSQLKTKILTDKSKSVDEHLASEIPGFKALDDYTIQIQLEKPYRQILMVLQMGFGAPVPVEAVQKYGQQGLNDRMIGTGPFRLREFSRGSKIILEKNPSFREEKYPSVGDKNATSTGLLADAGKALPFLDGIEFQIIKEDSPNWLQFQKGRLDVSGIPKDSFDTAVSASGELSQELRDKGIGLQVSDRPVAFYLNFNMKDALVGKNVNLRRALVRAIDRDFMIRTFLNGRGIKATTIVPPGIEGHTGRKELVGDFNIAEAKEYLKKAGYPDGANLPTIRFDLRGAATQTRQQGDYIKQALAQIGVNVEVIANTFPAYLEKEKTGNLQFFIGGWSADYPDPENFLQLLYSKNVAPGPNASNWQNAKFDALYQKIADMSPGKAKDALVMEAEKIAFDDAVWSMLFFPRSFDLSHAWVKNYRPNDLINNDLKYLRVDGAEREKLLKEKF